MWWIRAAIQEYILHSPSYSPYQPAAFSLLTDNQRASTPRLLAGPRFGPYLSGAEG
jgi:hypothetical protein